MKIHSESEDYKDANLAHRLDILFDAIKYYLIFKTEEHENRLKEAAYKAKQAYDLKYGLDIANKDQSNSRGEQ